MFRHKARRWSLHPRQHGNSERGTTSGGIKWVVGNKLDVSLSDWRKAYIAGIVDNHCGLVVTVGKDENRAIGYRVGVECRIKLRSEQSINFVTKFCDDCGVSYRKNANENKKYEGYEIVVGRRSDLKKLLTEIQPYLVARDEAVELLCLTIIPRLEDGDHRDKRSFIDLMSDIEEFRQKVGRANRAKYDLQYFSEQWEMELEAN